MSVWRERVVDVLDAVARIGRDAAHEMVVNVVAAVALGGLAFVLLGGRIEGLYFRLRGPAPVSGQVAIVAVDEESFYLWNPADPEPEVTPRALLAELTRFLTAAGAKVVVLDVLTDLPAEGDDALVEAARAHGRVVAAERFTPGRADDPSPFAAASVLREVALPAYANLGLEEQTLFSGEMSVSAVPLVASVSRARLTGPFPLGLVGGFQDDDAPTPSLALASAWLHANDAPPAELASALGSRCGGTPSVCTAGTRDLGLPASPEPLHRELAINFRGPEGADHIPSVSASRLLRSLGESALAKTLGMDLPVTVPEDLRTAFGGKVVLVGRVDGRGGDHFVTPYSFPTMQSADMTGVRVQAQLVDTLISGRHVRRVEGVMAWVAAVLASLAVLGTARRAGAFHLIFWTGVAGVVVAAATVIFGLTDGLVLDVAPTLGAIACTLLAVHLYARARAGDES